MRDKIKQKQHQREWYLRQRQDLEWVEHRKLNNRLYRVLNKDKVKLARQLYNKEHPWFRFYKSIWTRCSNPKCGSYPRYGGKGIKNFLQGNDLKFLWNRDKAYLLKQPSIHRKDSNDHYTLDNCGFIELVDNISPTYFTSKTGKIARQKQLQKSSI